MTATSKAFFLFLLIAGIGLNARRADAGGQASSSLAGQFQSAITLYQTGHLAQAHEVLSGLLRQVPNNFQLNELMALVCEAQRHSTEAEAEFKKAAGLAPKSYDANHNLGEFYIHAGDFAAAVSYLQIAQQLRPSYDNGYDWALAEVEMGQYAKAKQQIRQLLSTRDTAELHSLLAEADENSREYIQAANEYELAARMDPSEENIFDWGGELLLHHTLQPAIEVFKRGVNLYPRSVKLQIGLGMALYSSRQFQKAFQALCRAADLNPEDPHPYLILGQTYDTSPVPSQEVTAHFARFARREPDNPKALYYYALGLWETPDSATRKLALPKVETLLNTAIKLDPAFGEAHLQLGMVYAERKQYDKACVEYYMAIHLDPDRADAHYRLARALFMTGDKTTAQKEISIFDRLHAQQTAKWEAQRKSIIAFAYQMNSQRPLSH